MKQKRYTNEVLADQGSWVELDISTPSYPNATMKIDKADYALLRALTPFRICAARVRQDRKRLYAVVKVGQRKKLVHKVIFPRAEIIDHKNRDSLDNRRANLRECTIAENNYNSSISSNNTSGRTGVYWCKKSNRWRALIFFKKKEIYLGVFKEFSDAVAAREAAEKKYFKEFSPNG